MKETTQNTTIQVAKDYRKWPKTKMDQLGWLVNEN